MLIISAVGVFFFQSLGDSGMNDQQRNGALFEWFRGR